MTTVDVAAIVSQEWRSALDVSDADAETSFFELGGNSLSAVMLMESLESKLGIEFPLPVLFLDGRLSAVIEACVECVDGGGQVAG